MPDKKMTAEEAKATKQTITHKKMTPEEAKGNAMENKATDPDEEKIEQKRLSLKIPTPDDYKTAASRQALGRLNMKNDTKQDTPDDMLKRQANEKQAKPFAYKKGGRVKKGGLALIHTGERVLTKSAAKKYGGGNARKMGAAK
jgi:hypothetical protein